jgi:2-oxoglutarate dehydrogenase E2 component (dihydrolipoamide succinyltransferase)
LLANEEDTVTVGQDLLKLEPGESKGESPQKPSESSQTKPSKPAEETPSAEAKGDAPVQPTTQPPKGTDVTAPKEKGVSPPPRQEHPKPESVQSGTSNPGSREERRVRDNTNRHL